MNHREHLLSLTILFLLLFAATSTVHAGAVYTVNSAAIGDTCDDVLTLDEATYFAANDFTPTGRGFTPGERAQIQADGWIGGIPCGNYPLTYTPLNTGSDFADDMVFTTAVGTITGVRITLGKNDDIDGLRSDGIKVELSGTGTPGGSRAILIRDDSGSQIRNLKIRNYPSSAIFAQALNGAIFEGLELNNNGGAGLSFGFSSAIGKNSRNVRIGGSQPQHRNLIYANGGDGIVISASPSDDRTNQNITIENNYIGTSNGTSDNGNAFNGIYLENTLRVIVGDLAGSTRNVISGNNQDGIKITGIAAGLNVIVGNFIGVTSAGTAALGNTWSGVSCISGAGSGNFPNEIGRQNLGNVISSNAWGVFISDASTSNNTLKGNKIGTNLSGNLDLGNTNTGVHIAASALNNTIGGGAAADANEISFNGIGINHSGAGGNMIRRNSIHDNDGLGIDLAPAGVTPNDNLDGDGGPNNLQNYPVITFVQAFSNNVTIQGTLHSAPNQAFIIDLYGNAFVDPSGSGEGRTWLGGQQITTNGSGNATFNVALNIPISSVGQWVTATATDASNNTSEFSVARNICASPTASPTSITAPIGGITSSFIFINSTGCAAPTVASNRIWITGVSYMAGTVNFTVATNFGPPRDGAVVATFNNGSGTGTLDFNISQNNGCAYSMTPLQMTRPFVATTGNVINVATSDTNCTWSVTNNAPSWIGITFVDGSGDGNVGFNVFANPGGPRIGTITVGQMTFTVLQAGRPAAFDFNGDGKTEIGVFRPNGTSGAEWWIQSSSAGTVWATTFGTATDVPVPGDYTGDSIADVGYWRPSTGQWNILRSENFTYYAFPFGANGDIPVPADYDGDFKADAAVFRPSNGTWYIARSTGGTTIQSFGQNGDKPVPADYDRDGRADIAIYRAPAGQWWIQRSSAGLFAGTFGTATDKPVPGDYTGDLRADVAFWRPSTGEWFILRSEDFSYYSFAFGTSGDLPAPGDYDGDGRHDATVFRPSSATWFSQRSTAGTLIHQFGSSGDRPVPNVFVP